MQVFYSVRPIRFELTHPFVWALPPQGSASTNFAMAEKSSNTSYLFYKLQKSTSIKKTLLKAFCAPERS